MPEHSALCLEEKRGAQGIDFLFVLRLCYNSLCVNVLLSTGAKAMPEGMIFNGNIG